MSRKTHSAIISQDTLALAISGQCDVGFQPMASKLRTEVRNVPQLTISEEQVLELLRQLSPEGKKKALELLMQEVEWEQIGQQLKARWSEICAEEGIDWERLSDEEKEAVLDEWLHRR